MKRFQWCRWVQLAMVLLIAATEVKFSYYRAALAWARAHPDGGAYNVLGAGLSGGIFGAALFFVALCGGIALVVASLTARRPIRPATRWRWIAVALAVPAIIAFQTYWWRYSRGWW